LWWDAADRDDTEVDRHHSQGLCGRVSMIRFKSQLAADAALAAFAAADKPGLVPGALP
jgi:hypothetical protein